MNAIEHYEEKDDTGVHDGDHTVR